MVQSNALWPEGVCSSMYGDNISTDYHFTRESALSVCFILRTRGFGGMKKHFPIKTWVSKIQQPPKIPKD